MASTRSRILTLGFSFAALAGGGCDESSSEKWDPADYATTGIGQMDLDYSFLVTSGNSSHFYMGPSPSFENVSITTSANYTHIVVETDDCTVEGDFESVDDEGVRRYEIDLTRSICNANANGSPILVDFHENTILWGPEDVSFLMSGQGTIPGSSSIVLFYFDTDAG